MAVLSERQQKAQALARELGSLEGVWIVNPMPLPDHSKLRVQILDTVRNRVLQMLKDAGYEPQFVTILPRVHNVQFDMGAAVYEIDLPRERQPIHDDRIHGELAKPEKTSLELEGMRKYLGLK